MNHKISPIIIAVVAVVIVAMVGLGIVTIVKKNNSKNQEEGDQANVISKIDSNTNVKDKNKENVINSEKTSEKEPYLPKGFTHVSGKVESGYVIQDEAGNEFVWVPVESGKLTRNRMSSNDYEESESTASALVNSVAQNYGFYMARYEASMFEVEGEKVAASMKNQSPWTNLTYPEAAEAASKAASTFEYEGCQTAIANSYAWDTTLKWLDSCFEGYSSSTSNGNYSGSIKNTGATESDMKNNICDLAGNVREWTTEIYKVKPTTTNTSEEKSKSKNKNATNEEVVPEIITYRVIRGGSAELNKTASGYNGYKENMTDDYWGFRMILYK